MGRLLTASIFLMFLMHSVLGATNPRLGTGVKICGGCSSPWPCQTATACAANTGKEILYNANTGGTKGCAQIWSMNTTGGNKINISALMYTNGVTFADPNLSQGTPTYSPDGLWTIWPSQVAGSAHSCTEHSENPGAAIDFQTNACDTATYTNCAILVPTTPSRAYGTLHPRITRDGTFLYWGEWEGLFAGATPEGGVAGSLEWATFTPGTPPTIGTIHRNDFAGDPTNGGGAATALATSATALTFAITNPGSYNGTPLVTLTGGSGTYTSAAAHLTGFSLTSITVTGATGYTTGDRPVVSLWYAQNWYEPADSDGAIGTATCWVYVTTDRTYPTTSYTDVGVARVSLGSSAIRCPPLGTYSFISDAWETPSGCYTEFWTFNTRIDTAIGASSCFQNGPVSPPTTLELIMGQAATGAGTVPLTGWNLPGDPQYYFPTLNSTPHQSYDGSYIVTNVVNNAVLEGIGGNFGGATHNDIWKYPLILSPVQVSGKVQLSGQGESK